MCPVDYYPTSWLHSNSRVLELDAMAEQLNLHVRIYDRLEKKSQHT